ncbi:four helix bundle protein [Algoriphagus sp. SE2]|uniref:four helix bundle protein n=1 Tax=Algoriphagus sp. SE2 TaxID=3141536 RepID=UPI0031CD506E
MDNPIQKRTLKFAEIILDAYLELRTKGHFLLADQLVGAGTSIGANIDEAQAAHSKLDFISKLTIANKEARETQYWLNILDKEGLLLDFPEKRNRRNNSAFKFHHQKSPEKTSKRIRS